MAITQTAENVANAADIEEARAWIADCEWADEDFDPASLSYNQIRAGVERHYVGGWDQFLRDGGR